MMKEINIGNILIKKRREKGITQEFLANYIGVSKTAVSKWETGQSYPDVTFLPQLASYFDITLDELLDYHPQMSEDDIAALYSRLCKAFAEQPFDEVLEECHQIIHKYYSCYPLLMYMGVLLINHGILAKTEEQRSEVYGEARDLLCRVRMESDQLNDARYALELEAYCDIILEEPDKAMALLGDIKPIHTNSLLANAYFMSNRIDEAELAVQVDMFQGIIIIFQESLLYLQLHMQEADVFEDTLNKLFSLDECFHVCQMHPGVILPVYLLGIQGYVVQGKVEEALDLMEKYVHLILEEITSYEMKGMGMFSRIHEWNQSQKIQLETPRDPKIIKMSAISGILDNPALAGLQGNARYEKIVKRLKEGGLE